MIKNEFRKRKHLGTWWERWRIRLEEEQRKS